MKIVLILVLFLAVYCIYIFNSIIRLKVRIKNAWADIDAQLKRRHDLVPNLVEIVKGYASHEKRTFEETASARANAVNASSPGEASHAENNLQGAIKSIFAVSENYPQLKANTNFLELQKALTDVEDKIQYARRYYNAVVRDFNTKIQVFPNNFVAGVFHFNKADFFQLESAADRKAVEINV